MYKLCKLDEEMRTTLKYQKEILILLSPLLLMSPFLDLATCQFISDRHMSLALERYLVLLHFVTMLWCDS